MNKKWAWIIECIVIVAWALWVGRGYLNFDPLAVPSGREYGLAVHPHYVWDTVKECGRCIFWNGFWNGGYPAFAELHGAVAHPLVAITTLLAGVVNGSKLTVLISLMVAGMAQLWLGYLFRLRFWSRLWGSLLIVAGGHLAGKMEFGLIPLVTSVAFCSLIIPALIQLGRRPSRRNIVILAVTFALAAVSGQGYVQIGLIIGVFPFALALLYYKGKLSNLIPFLLAGGIALLLASYFIVPLLHFFPNFDKALTYDFSSAQPLNYIPLNLVIDDIGFLNKSGLGKMNTLGYLYINFIGWIPILLAIVGIHTLHSTETDRRERLFLLLSIVGVLLMSAQLPYAWVSRLSPRLGGFVRYPNLTAALLVPLIVTLAMVGYDKLNTVTIPTITLNIGNAGNMGGESDKSRRYQIPIKTLLMGILFILSLSVTSTFSTPLYSTTNTKLNTTTLTNRLTTESAQWVVPIFGEHFRNPFAAENGLKMTQTVRPSWWADRPMPPPRLFASYQPHDEGTQIDTIDNVLIYDLPENEYAYVEVSRNGTDGNSADSNGNREWYPCKATATGGHIDVTCDAPQSGRLIVTENAHPAWKVWQDGERISLVDGDWLTVDVDAGEQSWSFRYRPWDIRIGFMLTVVGIVLSIALCFDHQKTNFLNVYFSRFTDAPIQSEEE